MIALVQRRERVVVTIGDAAGQLLVADPPAAGRPGGGPCGGWRWLLGRTPDIRMVREAPDLDVQVVALGDSRE